MSSLAIGKLQFWMYRLSTICKSFKYLYTLSPEKLKDFINSYEVYNFDWADEKELITKLGAGYYSEVQKQIVNWYSVLNHLCALGQVEKMYIPPAMDLSKSIIENQILFERRMGRDLLVGKGSQVLDIGCGRGRVANHIAAFTGANVTGINIDASQLESAKKFALGTGRANQCQFKYGDLNDLPLDFADNSLDGIYHVQVFSLSKDWLKLFKDMHRILKPGGRFACLDWVQLDNYDATNPHHADLMRRIKPLIGAIGTPTIQKYVGLLQEAGFEIIANENASLDGLQAPLIENADRFYTRASKLIKFFVRCKILPAHFIALFERLTQDGEAFVEADRLRLVSTSHYIVAQKKA